MSPHCGQERCSLVAGNFSPPIIVVAIASILPGSKTGGGGGGGTGMVGLAYNWYSDGGGAGSVKFWYAGCVLVSVSLPGPVIGSAGIVGGTDDGVVIGPWFCGCLSSFCVCSSCS